MRLRSISLVAAALCAALLAAPSPATAFCGFYVSGGTADLYNNATMVVMMREGTRTVLSMQNNYEGPPEEFALVVPVPVVLHEENVKVLSAEIFHRVDEMAAPRLVEYWEQDPCNPHVYYDDLRMMAMPTEAAEGGDYGGHVTIEAQFEVGEYDIVVLGADDSSALDSWLRDNEYNIPEGAEPVLRPYIAAGMKFFVAKVNPERVTFRDGQAMLSPLRFHYDSERFELPIRLGLLNAHGEQDLLVHILAPDTRYEAANYTNVTIPTNLEVSNETRDNFGAFFATLFDKTIEENPGAIVTEYSWDASSCDPCPGPTLTEQDFLTLGADVLPSGRTWGFVLTRLHMRYTEDSLGEDLVFQAGTPIVGGREFLTAGGQLERGAQPSGMNNFQARFIIRHRWEGAVDCQNPVYGQWGGPGGGGEPRAMAAEDTAFVTERDLALTDYVREPIPELGIERSALSDPAPEPPTPEPAEPVAVASGFSDVSQTGISGGPNAASTIGGSCAGWIPAEPSHTLNVTELTPLFLSVTSQGDTVLVVRGPGGPYCNDDFAGLNPGLAFQAQPGTYEVFVGNYGQSAAPTPYTFRVQRQ